MVLPGSSLAETRTLTSPTASMPSVTAWTENSSKVAKAYTLKMDFLDTAGNVVETMTVEVPTVKPGERGNFELTPTKPGIVAYKYEALK